MKPIKQDTRIKLKLNGQDGNAVFVCIDKSTELKKLVKVDHHSVKDLKSVSFCCVRNSILGEPCPDKLYMDDEDEIDTIFYDPSARINLNVKGKDGNEASINILRSTQLKKLMEVYCYKHCLDINGVVFRFNGRLLEEEQTPNQLQMVDGDEINVVFYDQIARIKLKVKCQDENEVLFSINRSTQLKKLMNAYCDRRFVDYNSIAFWFNEHRVQPEKTRDKMKMVDGDKIDAIFYDQSTCINLKVKGQVGFEASLRIHRSTRLKKLMNVYCRRYCFDFDEVAFLFNGRLIESEQTPDELGMKDGNEMLAMLQLRCV